MLKHATAAVVALSVGALACGQPPTAPSTPACDPGPDWICDIQPLVQRHCVNCHAAEGIAPFSLTDYETAALSASHMKEMTAARLMPPWPPTDEGGCPPLAGDRRLTDEEIALVGAWADLGAPLGVAGSVPAVDTTPPPEDGLGTSPLEAMPQHELRVGDGYTPNASLSDDYRCFVTELPAGGDRWLHAYEVIPRNRRIVHHVLLYVVLPEYVAELQQWDDAEAGPGFTCFGSPAPGVPLTVGGWVPGQRPQRYREGDGAWIPAGAKMVVQIHYNLLMEQSTDVTTVRMYFVDGQPYREIATLPFPLTDFRIPAGNPEYTYARSTGDLPDLLYSQDIDLKLEGVAPHMHTLGKRISVHAVVPGSPNACLVDIPRWDFHWQGFYLFAGLEPLSIPTGSTFRLSCTWDNSPENQLEVNGEQLVPRDVTWGEGTTDEMCLAYLIISGVPGWTGTLLQLWNLQ